MAATALAKLLPPGLSITLVESDEIGIVGVGEATIPAIKLFNAALGMDETRFIRETQATYKLGIEFVDWSAFGSRYIHAFGEVGMRLGLIEFHQYWARALLRGNAPDLWSFSPNALAARDNRFAHLGQIADTPMTGLAYAFHFDAAMYASHLRSIAEAAGVVRVEGKISTASQRPEDGYVDAVCLDDGRIIKADLFIDCSGFRGWLIEQCLKTGYEDWRRFLPCDRAIAIPTQRVDPLMPFTRSTAREAGWQWRIPLQHRTGNGYVYCSNFLDDDEAARLLLERLDAPALADPRPLRFVTGRRTLFWNKNVVALGLASGFMEPLESTSIHLIQSGIMRLITLFPDKRFAPHLRDEYNRLSIIEFERIRDFLVLHYHANTKSDQAFWRACQELPLTDTLARKIALFKESARIHREADELFTEAAWLQVLVGQGVTPQAYHPLADAVTDAQLTGFFSNLQRVITRAIALLPEHDAHLKSLLRQN